MKKPIKKLAILIIGITIQKRTDIQFVNKINSGKINTIVKRDEPSPKIVRIKLMMELIKKRRKNTDNINSLWNFFFRYVGCFHFIE